MENNGTVYLNAGNIRGDFSTIAEGRKMDSSFIMKDGYTYNWSSFAPTMGVKVKVNTTTDGDTNTQTSGTYSWNAEQIGELFHFFRTDGYQIHIEQLQQESEYLRSIHERMFQRLHHERFLQEFLP
jgi:hypothetical protein